MSHSPHPSSGWAPQGLERTLTRTVRAASNGFDYRISLSVPDRPPPVDGYPLLVILDGNALFPTVAETERRLSRRSEVTRVVPTVIVGVGPADTDLYDAEQRRRDFTAGPPIEPQDGDQGAVGGADALLAFLTDQVVPLACGCAPVDPSRVALMGHSLAGLFTLEVLTTRPELFAAYGIVSPSIWWDPDRLLTAAKGLPTSSPRVMLAVGTLEQRPDEVDARRAGRRMVDAVREMGAALRSTMGADRVEVTVFPDEDHASVVSVATVRMLRLIGG